MKVRTGVSAMTLAALACANHANAQDSSTQHGLQEIIVTAQKRAESAQSVPVAITAVSGATLQAKGITDVASLAGQAPSVTLKSTAAFGGSTATLYSYIRGIGQNDFGFNLEPGVGLYVDGVYLARNIGANVDLLDLERVEVLKGPQGTLFGRNTIGGALSIVTRDPGKEWKVKGDATTGSYNRIDVRASVDAPLISDVLRASVSVSTRHRDGYQQRIPYTGYTNGNPIYLLATNGAYGGPNNTNTDEGLAFPITNSTRHRDAGSQNQTSVRGKLLFTPTDRLKIRLIGDYLHVDQAAAPFSLLQVNQTAYVAIYNACITGDQNLINGFTALAGFPGIPTLCNSARGNPSSPTGTSPSLASQAGQHLPYDNRYIVRNPDGSINPDKSYASGANYDKVENWGLNLQVEYDLTQNLQIKSITGYRRLKSAFGVDIGGAPFSALNPTFADRENQLSEELQLIGKAFNQRWKYVLGGYFFHEYGSHDDGVPFTGGLIQIWSPNATYDTKSYALYTHNNIDIVPDKVGITLGARYTHEDKSFTGAQSDENNFGGKLLGLPSFVYPDPSNLYRVYPLGKNYLKFNNFSFRVGAEYHVNRRIMAYASYATAFKGGGWTTRLTAPNFNPVTFQVLPAPTFGPEKAKTAEIGLKSELLDRKVRLNLAVFNTDYDNIQLTFQNSTSPVTANGGNGRIRGIEAELNTQFTPEWSFDASVGYLDAKYTRILSGVPLTGQEQFVNTPKWALQAGTSYRLDVGKSAFIPRIDWTFASRIANDEANSPLLATPPHSLVNGSLTYQFADKRFEIQGGVTNMFDKRFIQSGYTNAQAIYSGTYNRPREWFLTLRVKS